jgi:pimeloyl-ACP methyl ester carboxylesterase
VREEPFESAPSAGIAPTRTLRQPCSSTAARRFPTNLGGLAEELDGLLATIRYTQRGTPQSGGGPPFSIESHMGDAMSILDAFGIDRAWVVGHSWGAHLGLHLLVDRPDRILGFVGVAVLGAVNVFAEADANMRRGLALEEVARIEASRSFPSGSDRRPRPERTPRSWPISSAELSCRACRRCGSVHGDRDPIAGFPNFPVVRHHAILGRHVTT